MLPREPFEQNELDRWPSPLGRRISKEGVGEVVTGSAVYLASHWGREVALEATGRRGSTETLLALENSWERVEDTLRRTLLSTESLVRRRATKAMGGYLGVTKETRTRKKPPPVSLVIHDHTRLRVICQHVTTELGGSGEEADAVPVLSAPGRLGESPGRTSRGQHGGWGDAAITFLGL